MPSFDLFPCRRSDRSFRQSPPGSPRVHCVAPPIREREGQLFNDISHSFRIFGLSTNFEWQEKAVGSVCTAAILLDCSRQNKSKSAVACVSSQIVSSLSFRLSLANFVCSRKRRRRKSVDRTRIETVTAMPNVSQIDVHLIQLTKNVTEEKKGENCTRLVALFVCAGSVCVRVLRSFANNPIKEEEITINACVVDSV